MYWRLHEIFDVAVVRCGGDASRDEGKLKEVDDEALAVNLLAVLIKQNMPCIR
jgi:hypothetical protein